MFNLLCHFGNWGSPGTFDTWGWTAMFLNLIFWLGLIAGLTLLFVWVIRRARVRSAKAQYATGRPTAKEILQAQYARGQITREQYKLMKQDMGQT